MRVLVVRTSIERNPIRGSIVSHCEQCKEQIWISPGTLAGVVEFQKVTLVCSCCMGLCNCPDHDEWEQDTGDFDFD